MSLADRNPRGISIRVKIAGIVLGLLLLTTLVGIYRSNQAQRELLFDQLDQQGMALVRSASILCVDAIREGDERVLAEFARTLVEDVGACSIRITRQDGSVAVERSAASNDDAPPTADCRLFRHAVLADQGRGETLGHIEIGLPTTAMLEEMQGHAFRYVIELSLLALLGAALVIVFLQRIVARPARALSRAAERLAEGDLTTEVPCPSNDELGRLGCTLDAMRRKILSWTNVLKEKNAELEKLSRIKDEFLANMSHEIRTPMNGIVGMTELLLMTDLTDEQKEYAETGRSSAEFLLALLNDILDFSKIEADMMELEAIPFDLSVTVEEVADLLAAKLKSDAVELVVRYSPDCPRMVVGDPGRIRQIVLNLANNAVKFTRQGHVLVSVEGRRSTEGTVLLDLAVEDSGIGIDAAKLESIFEKFTQADGSTTREYGGTGLGLAICRRLIDLMRGEIRVTSEPGKGSRFSLSLELPAAPEETELWGRDLDGRSVLLVEDCEVTAGALAEQIRSRGAEVRIAGSGSAALKELSRSSHEGLRFDVVLIDMGLPDMDSFEVARNFQAHRWGGDTPCILMHALGSGELSEDQEALFAAQLCKPVKNGALHASLKLALSVTQQAEGSCPSVE